MTTTDRPQHEIEHGKLLADEDTERIWGWGTPAGRLRAKRRAGLIAEGAMLGPDIHTLEIGCGTGLFTEMFARTGARITAIDMNSGEHVWQAANGDSLSDHPALANLELPPLGIASRPVALVTRTLLFIGDGSNVFGGTQPNMWGRMFRAFDKATGEILWEMDLPAGTTGGPMTYMHEGKQYIVVAVGGLGDPAEWVALALP